MILPTAAREIIDKADAKAGLDAVGSKDAGGDEHEVVAGAVEIGGKRTMLGKRAAVALQSRAEQPFDRPQIPIGFRIVRHAELEEPRRGVVDQKVLERVRQIARRRRQGSQPLAQRAGIRPHRVLTVAHCR